MHIKHMMMEKIDVYIQDAYNTYDCDIYSEKWEYIAGTMKQTTGIDTSHPIDSNSWVFNYTSCAQWNSVRI